MVKLPFKERKPVIGMLHLLALPGEPGFDSIEKVVEHALTELDKLQTAGLNGVLVENWKHDSRTAFVEPQTAQALGEVLAALRKSFSVPFGLNVLNNDYPTAFRLAAEYQADFVQLDVLVDKVESDYTYSSAKDEPFKLIVDVADVQRQRANFGLANIPLFSFIQPKHYRMLEAEKTIEQSAQQAIAAGADGLLVTKATGTSPSLELIKRVKLSAKEKAWVGIGSGLSHANLGEFLPVVDFAVVGSALKIGGDVDNEVDFESAQRLMDLAQSIQANTVE